MLFYLDCLINRLNVFGEFLFSLVDDCFLWFIKNNKINQYSVLFRVEQREEKKVDFFFLLFIDKKNVLRRREEVSFLIIRLMKPKYSKRIPSNKTQRRTSMSSIFPGEPAARHNTYPIDMSHNCFKANLILKTPKLIKRDLLRSNESRFVQIRRSQSADAVLSTRKIDLLGPWNENSHSSLTSKKRDVSRPLKNLPVWKNSQSSSPKLLENENSTFESSIDMSIEQYRKNKGYRLELNATKTGKPPTNKVKEQPLINKSNVDFIDQTTNTSPSIPSVTKIISVPYYIHNFPSITMRNGHLRSTRQPPHHPPLVAQQAVALPALTGSSINYLNTLNSTEKSLSNASKTSSSSSLSSSQSKLFFIHGRKKKRYFALTFCTIRDLHI